MHTYGSMCEFIRVASSRSRQSNANVVLSHDSSGAHWLCGSVLSGFAIGDSVASAAVGTNRSEEEGSDVEGSDEEGPVVESCRGLDCVGMSGGEGFSRSKGFDV